MSTERQIEANRRNALKSTGPKSDEGKSRSSMNALRHGLTASQAVLPPRERGRTLRDGILEAACAFLELDSGRLLVTRGFHGSYQTRHGHSREYNLWRAVYLPGELISPEVLHQHQVDDSSDVHKCACTTHLRVRTFLRASPE